MTATVAVTVTATTSPVIVEFLVGLTSLTVPPVAIVKMTAVAEIVTVMMIAETVTATNPAETTATVTRAAPTMDPLMTTAMTATTAADVDALPGHTLRAEGLHHSNLKTPTMTLVPLIHLFANRLLHALVYIRCHQSHTPLDLLLGRSLPLVVLHK